MSGRRDFETYTPQKPHDLRRTWESGDFAPQEGLLGIAEAKAVRRDRDLMTVIESDIIPRLMLLHRNGIVKGDNRDSGLPAVEPMVLAKFSQLVLNAPLDVLVAFVKRLADEGYSPKTILLDFCAPVARWLGDQWVADEVDFVAVTLSLSRLQQLVREIVPDYAGGFGEMDRRRALIVPTPGEQHSFGAVMAAELLRECGWVVDVSVTVSADELKDLVTRENYAMIGFSQSTDVLLDNLGAAIRLVRETARAQPAAIVVGGRLAAERPELCSVVGADRFVKDTSDAVEYVDGLIPRLSHMSP